MKLAAKSARAFAPASVANIAVGFDLLGFAAPIAGDTVTVSIAPEPTVTLEPAKAPGSKGHLPTDPRLNTATAGLVKLIEDRKLKHGFHVSIEKGIPMGSGLGGSAASSVAGIVAASSLLEKGLTKTEMVYYALIGEAVASGSFHADNVAPSLYGGLTLATLKKNPDNLAIEVTELPIPENLWCVVLHPNTEVETKMARGILKPDISLRAHIEASGRLASFISGLYKNDLDLIGRHLRDDIVEPQRAHLIQGFSNVQKAALGTSGVLGCSISGAGPSIFAWTKGERTAESAKVAMLKASPMARAWSFAIESGNGARLIP